jgi:hypothetical protein
MAESLEEYLQRLLQQAMEKKAPRPQRAPAPVLEAELVELVEVPPPAQAQARPALDQEPAEGALAAEMRIGSDRPLGNLGATSNEADAAASQRAKSIVDEIITLLHSPGGVQKALVLSEILQRPDERW